MKKKLRYNRVIIVGVVLCLIIGVFIYMSMHKNHYYEYSGDIQTYTGVYRQSDKIYTFDLKAFIENDTYYVSLNDMYNMMLIFDKSAQVYVDQNKHTLTYQLSDMNYHFDYGQDKIVYNNDCINLKDKDMHIYIYHKNVYISVYYIEKLLLKDEKKIKFKNKNAIIE